MHFEARKHYSQNMTTYLTSRKIIYKQRTKALHEDDLNEDVQYMLKQVTDTLVNSSVHEDVERENWDYDEVALQLREIFHFKMPEPFFKLEPPILRSNILTNLGIYILIRKQNSHHFSYVMLKKLFYCKLWMHMEGTSNHHGSPKERYWITWLRTT